MTEPALSIRAHGKLLLTGEYAVLDGALALAVPVHYGQSLHVFSEDTTEGQLTWTSRDEQGSIWFEAAYSLSDLTLLRSSGEETADRLQRMLLACRKQNPGFLSDGAGRSVLTQTDFPRAWGLGTSSTLIAALARWAGVDPYRVLFDTLGGSGYDIACAFAGRPLLYQLIGQTPKVEEVDFAPPFAAQLFFIFLEKKQNSRDGIRRYREKARQEPELIRNITALTRQCLEAQTLAEFSRTMLEHEQRISRALELPRVQEQFFSDFAGVVKSLGAWGGDFVLAAGENKPEQIVNYFREKGFLTVIPYSKMVL